MVGVLTFAGTATAATLVTDVAQNTTATANQWNINFGALTNGALLRDYLQQCCGVLGPMRGVTNGRGERFSELALAKARKLVDQVLTEEEKASWRDHDRVDVPSPGHPERTYRICRSAYDRTPKLDVLEHGRPFASVCIFFGDGHGDYCPDDVLVALVLLCSYAEAQVERIGNWSYRDGTVRYWHEGRGILTFRAEAVPWDL